jgi:TatD DNase family protein
LDYVRDASERPIQIDVFRRQCRAAVQLGLPLIVHSRGAPDETLDVLRECLPHEWRVHLHCFADDWHVAKRFMDVFCNGFIGVTGSVTFEDSKRLREVSIVIVHVCIVEYHVYYVNRL